MFTGYLAAKGFLPELLRELDAEDPEIYGDLILLEGPEKPALWAANIWRDPVQIQIESIGDAAKKLRAIQRNWFLYPLENHRRALLITEQLPKVSAKPLVFGTKAPAAALGSWMLIDRDTMLAAPHCSSIFPNGEVNFVEDKETPPSRAYLKLWELFTRLDVFPQPGERCLDLGSCPGGWTWVLQQLGAHVISVDKAPLAPNIAKLPNVEFRQESAFGMDPHSVGPVDWLFSDIVCYPQRLYTLVQKWIEAGLVKRFACTIKFQGEIDYEAVAAFAAIPGSQLLHLHNNKTEITWIKL
jgi:23S rRNA (cytidine2498-2'-O)-methyltransferase